MRDRAGSVALIVIVAVLLLYGAWAISSLRACSAYAKEIGGQVIQTGHGAYMYQCVVVMPDGRLRVKP